MISSIQVSDYGMVMVVLTFTPKKKQIFSSGPGEKVVEMLVVDHERTQENQATGEQISELGEHDWLFHFLRILSLNSEFVYFPPKRKTDENFLFPEFWKPVCFSLDFDWGEKKRSQYRLFCFPWILTGEKKRSQYRLFFFCHPSSCHFLCFFLLTENDLTASDSGPGGVQSFFFGSSFHGKCQRDKQQSSTQPLDALWTLTCVWVEKLALFLLLSLSRLHSPPTHWATSWIQQVHTAFSDRTASSGNVGRLCLMSRYRKDRKNPKICCLHVFFNVNCMGRIVRLMKTNNRSQ